MAFCVKCGQPLEGAFCGACGADNRVAEPTAETPATAATAPAEAPAAEAPAPVAAPAPAAEPTPTYTEAVAAGMPAPTPVKKGFPKWVIPVAIAVVAVIVAVVLFFTLGGNKIGMSDEQLIRARVDALESSFANGDWNGVVGCMDSASRAMIEDNSEMAQIESYFGMIGGMIQYKFEVSDIEIEGNTATAEMEMTMTAFGETQTTTEDITFVKEGNDWYMSGDMDSLL